MDAATGMSPKKSRERLFETATRLFYSQGINSTGIDTVIAEAKVAKGSMYHHFHNKQGLVATYLRGQEDAWKRNAEAVDSPTASAPQRVALMFSVVANAVTNGTFHGCPFTNAVVECPHDEAIRKIVKEYRRTVAEHIGHLLGTHPDDPVVSQVMVLYDGAITSAKQTHDPELVEMASVMAQQLTRTAIEKQS
ncbi:MAG: TetR/AcrR family transcriptional regulator [Terrimesophilobacter sp.]